MRLGVLRQSIGFTHVDASSYEPSTGRLTAPVAAFHHVVRLTALWPVTPTYVIQMAMELLGDKRMTSMIGWRGPSDASEQPALWILCQPAHLTWAAKAVRLRAARMTM